MKISSVLSFLAFTMLSTSLNAKNEIDKEKLERTIKGSLVTLINMQIQDRKGKNLPLYDACSEGDGYEMQFYLMLKIEWLPSGHHCLGLPTEKGRSSRYISLVIVLVTRIENFFLSTRFEHVCDGQCFILISFDLDRVRF